jgi:transposase
MSGLRPVVTDEQLEVLRLLVDRRRSLGDEHTRKTCQLHQLLLELVADLERIYARKKAANKELVELVKDAGTSLLDLLLPEQGVCRLSRAGNRQINRVLHTMARVQLRNPTAGRDYYERKRADRKAPMEAMRCVKRRLSDIVFQTMLNDAVRATATTSGTGPGGQRGHDSDSGATGSHPHTGSSEKSLPGPAKHQPTTPLPAAS